MHVISVTQEAEARGSLEPRSLRLQCAKITPLHSNLGSRVRLSKIGKNKTNKQNPTKRGGGYSKDDF